MQRFDDEGRNQSGNGYERKYQDFDIDLSSEFKGNSIYIVFYIQVMWEMLMPELLFKK